MYRSRQDHLPGLVLFDGPIGAGKTTLINCLFNEFKQAGYRATVVPEIIPDFLADYYRDPAKHAFRIQRYFIYNLYKAYEKACRLLLNNLADVVLLDRWFYSTRGFMEYQRAQGWLTTQEYDELLFIDNALLATTPFLPQLIVYLNEPTETCYNRVLKRSREGETITLEEHAKMSTYLFRYNRLCDDIFKSPSEYDLSSIFKHPRFKQYYRSLKDHEKKHIPGALCHAGIHPNTPFTYESQWPLVPRLCLSFVSYTNLSPNGLCTFDVGTKEPEEVLTTLLSYMQGRLPKDLYNHFLLRRPGYLFPGQTHQSK